MYVCVGSVFSWIQVCFFILMLLFHAGSILDVQTYACPCKQSHRYSVLLTAAGSATKHCKDVGEMEHNVLTAEPIFPRTILHALLFFYFF